MASKLARITMVVSALLVARMLLYLFVDPMDAVRADLARALAEPPGAKALGGDGYDYAALQNAIAARPALWQELVAAPAPPPEAPQEVARPNAPDLAALLEGITIGRGQIGENKIRLHTPEAPNGQWVAVGTVINGCTLDSFTPDEVIFTFDWKEGGKTLSLALPRP